MTRSLKTEYKVLLITGVAIVLVWIIGGVYGSLLFREGLFLRFFLTGSFLLFGIVIARIVVKQHQAEETFKKHLAAIDSSMDGITIYNQDGKFIYANQAFATLSGYANPQEVIGKTCKQFYDEQEFERMEKVCAPALQKSGQWRGELVAKRKNGSTYYQEASITMLGDGGRVCIIRDITWRKRSEKRLLRSERFLNTIFDSIRDPFRIFDSEYRIVRVNDAYAQMKNKEAKELIGRKCHEVLHNSATICPDCVVDKTFHSTDPCAKEKLVALSDGNSIWVEIYTYPILDEEGKVSHTIEYTRNITDRKEAEEEKRHIINRLEHLSNTDSLTGLLNRRALTDSLNYEIDRSKRYLSELSLVLCDIDYFKEINDTHGHEVGDRALQTISSILKTILRKTDIAGRHGGDEFMLILPETSIKGAQSLADKILSSVRAASLPLKNGRSIRLSMSIGISGLETETDNTDTFMKRADEAMYASKQAGRDRISTAKYYPLFP
jgi:diguanylate cyclase (GGDEF)-like protein/PAS domain S-box-containing protein